MRDSRGTGGRHLDIGGIATVAVDAVARETMLFAGVGFLIGGVDDLLIDLAFLLMVAPRWLRRGTVLRPRTLRDLPLRSNQRRMAVFVPAWDEAAVIAAMLTTTLARYDYDDYRIYVGVYPNDQATAAEVAAVAERDSRVRLVILQRPGPTTKADCLNGLWRALAQDEAAHGGRAAAIILHDAEDVVHSAELRIFDAMIDQYSVVQLPVLPLIARGSQFVSGHYADEFAESHGKNLVVRQMLGTGIPLAGVGCAIARGALESVSAARSGMPFDPTSLTEDYELGLLLGELGGGAAFVRIRERRGGRLIAVRAYFPARFGAAVSQKARWMIGIALAGWDRIGWARGNWREHWMRIRDRRAPAAVLVLTAAYVALFATALAFLLHALSDTPMPLVSEGMALTLKINLGLLVWRLAMRAVFTGVVYGPLQALLSIPRAVVANFIALAAVQRALLRYVGMLRGAKPKWDKTAHVFPDDAVLREP